MFSMVENEKVRVSGSLNIYVSLGASRLKKPPTPIFYTDIGHSPFSAFFSVKTGYYVAKLVTSLNFFKKIQIFCLMSLLTMLGSCSTIRQDLFLNKSRRCTNGVYFLMMYCFAHAQYLPK